SAAVPIPHGGVAAEGPFLPPPAHAADEPGAVRDVHAPAPLEEAPIPVPYARARSDVAAVDPPDATTEACQDALPAWPPSAGLDESVRGKSVVREPARSALWEFRDAVVPVVAA